jgi:tRNA(fMet)-specific endonuclease VapC
MEANRVVVDTGLFIDHLRAKDKTRTSLVSLLKDNVLCVSSLTVYELYCGATSIEKRADVATLLTNVNELLVDRSVAIKAADIYRTLKQKNQLIGPADVLIAATALVHGLPIKTLNYNHFNRVDGLVLL